MGRGGWAGSTVQMSLGWAPAVRLLPQGQWWQPHLAGHQWMVSLLTRLSLLWN